MKKIFNLATTMIILVICSFSCKKSASKIEPIEYSAIKGKVLRVNCEGAAIQIHTPNVNIGDSVWEDRQGSLLNPVVAIYRNVIHAANICTIREEFINKKITVGDTLYFDLKTAELSYLDNRCIICTGIESDMPFKKIRIYNISKK